MAKGRRTGGRKKGTPNKTTAQTKAALTTAFTKLGDVKGLVAWAEENRTEFYRLWSKLIPTEVTGEDGGAIQQALTIRVVRE